MRKHTLLLTALALLALSGCKSVEMSGSGDSVAAYNLNTFSMLTTRQAPAVAAAAEAALRELDLFIVDSQVNQFDAKITARTRKDERTIVDIREINSQQTRVEIRVGLKGDLNLSRRIGEGIQRNLGIGGGIGGGIGDVMGGS